MRLIPKPSKNKAHNPLLEDAYKKDLVCKPDMWHIVVSCVTTLLSVFKRGLFFQTEEVPRTCNPRTSKIFNSKDSMVYQYITMEPKQ